MRVWGACVFFIYLCIEVCKSCDGHPRNHFEAPSVSLRVSDGHHREYRRLVFGAYFQFMNHLIEAINGGIRFINTETTVCLQVIGLTQKYAEDFNNNVLNKHPMSQDKHDREWMLLTRILAQFQEAFKQLQARTVLHDPLSREYIAWCKKFNEAWNAILREYMKHDKYDYGAVQRMHRLSQV